MMGLLVHPFDWYCEEYITKKQVEGVCVLARYNRNWMKEGENAILCNCDAKRK
jgi:hypothetical protein